MSSGFNVGEPTAHAPQLCALPKGGGGVIHQDAVNHEERLVRAARVDGVDAADLYVGASPGAPPGAGNDGPGDFTLQRVQHVRLAVVLRQFAASTSGRISQRLFLTRNARSLSLLPPRAAGCRWLSRTSMAGLVSDGTSRGLIAQKPEYQHGVVGRHTELVVAVRVSAGACGGAFHNHAHARQRDAVRCPVTVPVTVLSCATAVEIQHTIKRKVNIFFIRYRLNCC